MISFYTKSELDQLDFEIPSDLEIDQFLDELREYVPVSGNMDQFGSHSAPKSGMCYCTRIANAGTLNVNEECQLCE